MAEKRVIDVLVLSDVHLGTSACRAWELNQYLKTVEPRAIVLNGDIIDLWDFRKGFWPESHTKVLRRLMKFVTNGVPVHYITGNHDSALRKYTSLSLGCVNLIDRLELTLGGRKHWFLHGDAFDLALGTPRWLSRLGAFSYDAVVTINTLANSARGLIGLKPFSMATYFKHNLAAAQAHIGRFERACCEAAAARGCDVVVCGHIHVAAMREVQIGDRTVSYLNSGDWVDSLSALEYANGAWSVVRWADLVGQGLVEERSHLEDTAVVA